MMAIESYPGQFSPWNPGMKAINGLNEWLDIRKEVEAYRTSYGWIGTKLHLNLQIKENERQSYLIANKCIKRMMQ